MPSAHRRHLRERKDLLIVRAALERMSLQTLAAELSPVAAARQWISRRFRSATSVPLADQFLRSGVAPWLLRWAVGRWFSRRHPRHYRKNKGLAVATGILSLGMPRIAKWAGIAGVAWQLWRKLRPSRDHSSSKSLSQ